MRNIFFILLVVFSTNSFCQFSTDRQGLLYESEWTLHGKLQTNGWGVTYEFIRKIDIWKKKIYQIELIEFKHPKEYKQNNDFSPRIFGAPPPKPFFFGKQNSFMALHFSYGYRKIIAEKGEKNGVALFLTYLGGLSLGIQKPYFLDISHPIENTNLTILKREKYDPKNPDPKFLELNSIYSSAGPLYGFHKMKLIPGLHGKVGLHFDFAAFDEFIKALEVGFALDIYPKKIQIMILEKNPQIFPTLYASFIFGKRTTI